MFLECFLDLLNCSLLVVTSQNDVVVDAGEQEITQTEFIANHELLRFVLLETVLNVANLGVENA